MTADLFSAIAKGIQLTIAVTFLALIIGVVAGGVLCVMRTSRNLLLASLSASVIVVLRSIPPMVMLLFIFFGVSFGSFRFDPLTAASVGLGLITAANMAETYRGALLSIHPGQWDAANALGLPWYYRFVDVIGPQLLRVSIPAMATYAIALLKESSIASAIGVQEIAFHASLVSKQTYLDLQIYSIAGLFYIVISIGIAWFARGVGVKLSRRIAR